MEFLIFGTFWFWFLLVGTCAAVIYVLESALDSGDDNGGGAWATVWLLVGIALYFFFGSSADVINGLKFVRDNPFLILGCFFAYVVVGVVWAFFKWYFFVNRQRVKSEKKIRKSDYEVQIEIPTASSNKFRIMSWMYYWPFSAFWTMINEPLRQTFEYVYTQIGGLFDKVSNKMFADVLVQNEKKRVEIAAKHEKEAQEYKDRHKKREQLNS